MDDDRSEKEGSPSSQYRTKKVNLDKPSSRQRQAKGKSAHLCRVTKSQAGFAPSSFTTM
jgi:hypothetical protein